jgi:hypothetical protein
MDPGPRATSLTIKSPFWNDSAPTGLRLTTTDDD